MNGRGTPAPSHYRPLAYWEDRAQRFAGEREGLAAVCSYGMPEFYNRVIDWEQRLALAPWLRVPAATRVLDVGCGVGRWSRLLAGRGADVLGVDLSPTMIAQAGSGVTGANLTLTDGTVVTATVQNGWVIAWWPGDGCFRLPGPWLRRHRRIARSDRQFEQCASPRRGRRQGPELIRGEPR